MTPVINNATFKILKNKKTAIVGKSGVGKTTLLNLIAGFYTPESGRIIVNNKNISVYSEYSYRKKIGYVMQEDFLFNGTIKENLTAGLEKISDNEIEYVMEIIQLKELIYSLRKGLDSEIGENGILLSAGERKRLAIARIILRNPDIIMFDESMSQIDSETEEKILISLNSAGINKTMIFIAHRLSSIKNADKIIFISSEKNIFEGNFEEMLSKNQEFKKLFESQLRII
ncbi:MAG TPA: ATP-binding cassette domain-containing protein [bacterium]|mgnify:CR=1 FL=1|nr:ATP-binding cassette domain-containing protein [bacterium]